MCDAVTSVVSAGFGLIGGSIFQGERARREQRAAARVQQRLNERQSQRQRLAQVREAQINRAQIQAIGASTDTGEASGVQGAAFSQTSSAASNIQFINQIESLQQEIQRRQERASTFAGQSALLGQAASIGNSFVRPTPNTGGS